jgi:hypothetical protein
MNNEEKPRIINYIYEKIHLFTHKFIKMERNEHITCLKDKKYYIGSNFCGIPSLLIFLKQNNNYYCYLIDRRTLSFEKNKLNISNVRMKEMKIQVDIKLYDGTIFDCVVIDETEDIIINDVFYYCSKNMLGYDYKNKMLLIKNFKYKIDKIKIIVSIPYELNNFSELFYKYIKLNSRKMNIRGISFYPEKSGTKLIYVFNKSDVVLKDNLMNVKLEIKKINKSDDDIILPEPTIEITQFHLKNISCDEQIILIFEVFKTNICDVFELYTFHDDNLIKKKIGLAYVYSYEISLKCKKMFENIEKQNIKCLFNKNNKKWIMLEKTNEKISILKNNKYLDYEILQIPIE